MCGIFGEFVFDGTADRRHEDETFTDLVTLMRRRGPDDAGTWSDGRFCSLGFRRLSILDLSSAGHQPMVTTDGRYAIVYNGELYNFRELRKELEREGVRFRSTGDTEVVLYALVRWGISALEKFNGMFALGFYDSTEKRLILARDHAGIKPLYCMRTDEGLVFASQYDQILRHPWSSSLKTSPAGLGLYLRFGYIAAPFAFLERTEMIAQGSWLMLTSDARIRRGTFFKLDVEREPDLFGEEAFEAVDAAVTAAVERHLVSDVPLGTFLSGGIDSPLVTAKACDLTNASLPSFTIGTGGGPLDESSDAAMYAAEIGVKHVVEHFSPEIALELVDDVVKACGEPFADYSVFPMLLVSRVARRSVKVVLSGDGGDELFWGYAARFSSFLRTTDDYSQASGTLASGRNLRAVLESGDDKVDAGWPTSPGDWYKLKHMHLPEGTLKHIFPDLPDQPAEFRLFEHGSWETDRTARWLRWNEFNGFMSMILMKVDRASMFEGLEVRVPLLDREVIEIASRVDWRSCLDMDRRIGKLPLRRVLERHVRHQTRTKRGFTVPMDAWLRGPLRPMFEDLVLGSTELAGLPLNHKAVRAVFDRHVAGEPGYTMGLWILLSLALWEETYLHRRRSADDNILKETL